MRKPGLTFERHVEIAKRLKIIRKELLDLWMELQCAYPKNSDCILALRRILGLGRQFDQLRGDLDSRLCREYNDKFDPEIYYGAARADS
jgi:hypothetical protein